MQDNKFIDECKFRVTFYHNGKVDILNGENNFIDRKDVHCVWYNKSLKNFKGLFVTIPLDGRYYECTYNGDKNELYLDVYKKEKNECIKLEEEEN